MVTQKRQKSPVLLQKGETGLHSLLPTLYDLKAVRGQPLMIWGEARRKLRKKKFRGPSPGKKNLQGLPPGKKNLERPSPEKNKFTGAFSRKK